MVAILFYLMLVTVAMVGPIAAALAEMFPTRIRYTSMSLPLPPWQWLVWWPAAAHGVCHRGADGDIYSGLWYPVLIAGATAVIGTLYLRETCGVDMYAPTIDGARRFAPGQRRNARPGR